MFQIVLMARFHKIIFSQQKLLATQIKGYMPHRTTICRLRGPIPNMKPLPVSVTSSHRLKSHSCEHSESREQHSEDSLILLSELWQALLPQYCPFQNQIFQFGPLEDTRRLRRLLPLLAELVSKNIPFSAEFRSYIRLVQMGQSYVLFRAISWTRIAFPVREPYRTVIPRLKFKAGNRFRSLFF